MTASPPWSSTVLFINFDEWGGFFDHVPPTTAPIPSADMAVGNDGRRGFRTPALLVSPFARRARTSHVVYDHTSVLRMIEWRWQLPPLSVRDASAHNLGRELDFTEPRLDAPTYSVPAVTGAVCPANPGLVASRTSAAGSTRAHWAGLSQVAREQGWPV